MRMRLNWKKELNGIKYLECKVDNVKEGTAPISSIVESVSVRLSVSTPVHLSVYLSACVSIRPSVCLSTYLCVFVCVCLYICVYVSPSIWLSAYVCVCVSVCLSVCLCIYLQLRSLQHQGHVWSCFEMEGRVIDCREREREIERDKEMEEGISMTWWKYEGWRDGGYDSRDTKWWGQTFEKKKINSAKLKQRW